MIPEQARARQPALVLAAATAAAAALIVWLGRDTTFTWDELAWILEYPGLSAGDVVEPHNGHLIVTSRLVYAGLIEVFGPGYLPFRALSLIAVIALAWTFFVYARPHIGGWMALGPAVVLLFFGTAASHVLQGNGFTVVLPLALGIGALIALRRETRAGDVLAAVLLTAAVATYTVGLAFVVGAAVILALSARRRLWVPAVPLVLYAVWWVWSQGSSDGSSDQLVISNLLVWPAWAFQSLQNVAGALAGLDYQFAGSGPVADDVAGGVLAVAAIAALAWRMGTRPIPPALWGAITIFLCLMAMQVLVETILRAPDSARYAYPAVAAILLVAATAVSGLAQPQWLVRAVLAVAVVGLAANVAMLRDGSQQFRLLDAEAMRSELGALEIAGDRIPPNFDPHALYPESHIYNSWETYGLARDPAEAYREFVASYGGIGYSVEELAAQDDDVRQRADRILTAALSLGVRPAEDEIAGCRPETPLSGEGAVVAPGSSVIVASDGDATVAAARFAEKGSVPVGFVSAGSPAVLGLPRDGADRDWRVTATGAPVRFCVR